jgi:hypothetical protein
MLARRVGRRTAKLRQRSADPRAARSTLSQCRVAQQLGSHAATVSSGPTARRRAEHASDVARQQDVTDIHVVEDIIRLP